MIKKILSFLLTITIICMPLTYANDPVSSTPAGFSFMEAFIREQQSYETEVYVFDEGTVYFAVVEYNIGDVPPVLNFNDIYYQISNDPDIVFVFQGQNAVQHTPVTTPSAVQISVSNLEPHKTYGIYAVHTSDSSNVIFNTIPKYYRSIILASYDNGYLYDLNDDTITLVLDQPYPDASLETLTPIIGIAGTNPFKELRFEDGYTQRMFANAERTVIVLTLDETAVSYLKNSSNWGAPTQQSSEIFFTDNPYFSMDYCFSDFHMTFDMVTTPEIIPPSDGYKLTSLSVFGQPITEFNSSKLTYVHNVTTNSVYNVIITTPEDHIHFEVEEGGQATLVASQVQEGLFIISVEAENPYYPTEPTVYALSILNLNVDNAIHSILINNMSYEAFSSSITRYDIPVGTSMALPTLTAMTQHNFLYLPFADLSIQTSGSFPGTYTVTVMVSISGEHRNYVFNFISSFLEPIDSDSVTDTTFNLTNSLTILGNTALTHNVDIRQLTASLTQLDLFIRSESNPTVLRNTATTLNTLAQALAAGASLSQNNQHALEAVSSRVGTVLAKSQSFDVKQSILSEFTLAVKPLKGTTGNIASIDKLVDSMIKNTSQSIATVKADINMPTGTLLNFSVDPNQLRLARINSENSKARLNSIIEDYFGDNKYIDLKSEVQIDIDVAEGDFPVRFFMDSEYEPVFDNLNLKMGAYNLTLPTGVFSPDQSLEIIFQRLDSDSRLSDPSIFDNMSNNKNFIDIEIFKEGNLVEHLGAPVKLTFDIDYFDVNADDNGYDIAVFRYDENNKSWEPVGGIYDPLTGTISVFRTHLSKYTVMKTTAVQASENQVKTEIQALLNKGIIINDVQNMKDDITREEFISWLGQAFGLTTSSIMVPFTDLDPQRSSYAYIASVYEQGIIVGKSTNEFKGNDFMTYEELAVVLANTLTKLDNKKMNTNLTKKLGDSEQDINLSDWSKNQVALIIELGIMDRSAVLNCKSRITREEAAVIFSKIYK